MSATDIMAKAILEAGKNMGALAHHSAKTFEEKIVAFQIEALTAAGYRLLGPDELDPVTVSKCIEELEAIVIRLPLAGGVLDGASIASGQYIAALRSLTGGGNG